MITITGIDTLVRPSDQSNAYDILTQVAPAHFAQLKALMGLGSDLVIGPQTLAAFVALCGEHGVTLSAIGSWKLDHGLTGGAAIGPTTAEAVYLAVMAPGPDASGVRMINAAGVQLVKSFEGLYLAAYNDGVGVETIGFGHTAGVHAGMTCTVQQAVQWLQDDLLGARRDVLKYVTVPLTDNQFAACVSIAFNVGGGCFTGTKLARDLAAKNYSAAADDFLAYNHGGGHVMAGLTRRRQAERALFLTA